MNDDLRLITNRHREVEQEIALLKSRVAELEAELPELETAGRVLARLSGAEWPPAGAADEPKPAETSGAKPKGLPPVTEMVMTIMAENYRQGRRGMEPKEVTNAIIERWWPNMKGRTIVSTTMWRMAQAKDGRLVKDEKSGVYMLANTNKADDLLSRQDQSSALQPNSMRPVEPAPGGGT